MYNPYAASTVSIRYKAPISYSYNDYRFNRHLVSSSQSCCCVCCSANYVHRNPINTRFVCGSRQSSLIHWSASRRLLILPGPDPCCFRSLARDPCRKCCCSCVKERKLRRMVSGGRSCDFETAEMMLSLLIEEVGEECYGVRERDYSSSRRVELEKRGSESDGFCRKEKTKKKNVGSGLLGSSSRSKYEVSRIELMENEAKNRRKEDGKNDKEEIFSGGKHRGRKSGSSCSSYYTCTSLGEESESDCEIHVRDEACGEESGKGYKKDSKESRNVVYSGEIKEILGRREVVVGSHKMIESDWRKKTEKKLDEVAIGEVYETSHHRDSSSHKQFDNFDNDSKFMISHNGTRQQYSRRRDQVIGGSEARTKQKQLMEVCEDDVKPVSSSKEQFNRRGEKSSVTGSFGLGEKHERVKVNDHVNQKDDYRLSTEQSDQVSQTEDVNVKRTNISQSQYQDKVKKQEDQFSVASSLVQGTEKCFYLKSEEDSRRMDSRRKFQQTTKTSDDRVSRTDDFRSSTEQSNQISQIQDMNVRRTIISQAQYEDRAKRKEDQSVISSSVHDTGRQYNLKSEEDLRQLDSRRKLRQLAEISDDHVSQRDDYRLSTEQFDQVSQIQDINLRSNISHEHYEDRRERGEDHSSLISSSEQDTENRYYLQSEEDSRQMDTRKKLQRSTEISTQVQDVQSGQHAISRKESAKGSQEMSTIMLGQSSGKHVNNSHKTSENRINNQETYSSMVVKSAKESKKRTERSDNQALRIGSKKETGVTSHKASSLQASLVLETTPTVCDESNSQAIVMTPQSRIPRTSSQSGIYSDDATYSGTEPNAPPWQHEILEGSTVIQSQTYDNPLTSISYEGALGSAHRSQKSSSKIVGEFLEKATHEASSSHRQIEESTSKEGMVLKGHTQEQKSSSEYGDVDFKSNDRESRRSSGSSGVKGPSDEIWDEVAPSTQEVVDTQTQVPERTSPSHNIVIKRTGRSLWNVFSDIIRLPWSSQSKTSTPKSGVRNSPNQANSSEAWFSGRDRDETSEENMKKGNENVSRESIPTPTESPGGEYSSLSSKDKMSSSKTPIGSTTPKGSSSASTEENLKMVGSTMMETLVSVPSLQVQRSPNVDDVAEFDQRTTISASGSLTGKEQVTISTPINVKGSKGIVGGDVKRRMLQRTNQVIKDRFDEWEEAFMLETEQRKNDEAFMREALLEARKAGDMWEVPVGAVLVQHGKIIARGYNLVEELRDSTAHAEMICIREASNQLRTWRLAETTLYVTLEPCPMCAGAILQARVDTVVWGAPNNLLGADGSWIRLFPGDGEGGTGSVITDKPPAPVHPFHPKIKIRRGVLGTECADVMQQFFRLRRRKKDKKQLPDMPPNPPTCLPISNHPTKILTKMHDAFHFMFCL